MRVAVLGGGYQGCCTAIELAGRDTQVVLYDRNSFLLAGAATANEGKIHLGYVYGGDRSFATARQMLSGSLPFASMMRRYLESGAPFALSKPYVYAVHRSSLYTVEDMAAYYDAVHELGVTAPDQGGYFGINLEVPPRRLTGAELDGLFDPAHVAAAFETVEVAIDSVALAEKMQARIEQGPRSEVRTEWTVEAVGGDDGNLTVRSRGVSGDVDSDRFDAVVNALWDGRLLIDASRGIRPTRKWMHRLKHGIRLRVAELPVLPSVTFALGPFGDLVNYGNGLLHVS
jgi:glycine/D-amino acid oxidase-like deaminating enzyme